MAWYTRFLLCATTSTETVNEHLFVTIATADKAYKSVM